MIESLTSTTKNTTTTNKLIATGAVVLATLLTACGTTPADTQADTAAATTVATEAPAITETPLETPVVEAPKTTTTPVEAPKTEAPAKATPVDTSKTEAPKATTPAPTPTPKAVTNNGPCPTYAVDNTFPVGLCAKGDLVIDVQEALRFVIVATEVDGYYGPDTEGTVTMLQSSFGLPETGIVDQATYQAIVEAGYDYEDDDDHNDDHNEGHDENGDEAVNVADWHDEPIWADDPGMNAGHDPEYYDNVGADLEFFERCNAVVDLAAADRTDPSIDEDELNMCIAILGH